MENKIGIYILTIQLLLIAVGCDKVKIYDKKFRQHSQDFVEIVSYLNKKHKINNKTSGQFLPLMINADEDELIKMFSDNFGIEYIAMTNCVDSKLNPTENFFMFKIENTNLFYSHEPCKADSIPQKIGQALQPHAVFQKVENLDDYKIPISMTEYKLSDGWFILEFKTKKK